MRSLRPILALFWMVAGLPAHAAEINVAVAANFLGTLQKLAPQFEQASGDKLVISSGSSGQFYTQIRQGAPFDVFLSADSDRPQKLEAEGLAVQGSRFTYAIGTLVLWSSETARVDRDGKVLTAGRYRFIGIADPKTAPYGAAAQQVLTALGLWDSLSREHKIAMGENINQAFQFAASGNVDMAFVALSQVTGANGISGSYWLPPDSLYTRLDQDAVLLTHTTKRTNAEAFLKWLRSDPDARATIKAAGYRVNE